MRNTPYRSGTIVPNELDQSREIYAKAVRDSTRLEIVENLVNLAIWGPMVLRVASYYVFNMRDFKLAPGWSLLIPGLALAIKQSNFRRKRLRLNEDIHQQTHQEPNVDTIGYNINELGYKSAGKDMLIMLLANIALRFLWTHFNWNEKLLLSAVNLDIVSVLGFSIATWINDNQLKYSSRNLINVVISTTEKVRVVEPVRLDANLTEHATAEIHSGNTQNTEATTQGQHKVLS